MTSNVIVLPDGSKCYSGPNCRKHGLTQRKAALESKINNMLATETLKTAKETNAEKKIRIAKEHKAYLERIIEAKYQSTLTTLEMFGLKEGKVSNYLAAFEQGYVSVEVDEETTICVGSDRQHSYQGFASMGEKYYCRAWLLKQGKPVAMLHFATYPQNYTPSEDYPYAESVICDVEVRKEYQGKGYALETIKQVEKHVLGGRLIHSGGSYTPEGRNALGGKLPYTAEAKYKHKSIAEGKIPDSSFQSMKFVNDWDALHLEH